MWINVLNIGGLPSSQKNRKLPTKDAHQIREFLGNCFHHPPMLITVFQVVDGIPFVLLVLVQVRSEQKVDFVFAQTFRFGVL